MPIHQIMEIDPRLIQFGGSLVAIIVLAWLALALQLGPKPGLENAQQAANAASEVHDGFVPVESAVARDGSAAVLRDDAGQVMLIKTHGTKFAGRILSSSASATVSDTMLVIDTGEARFGQVTLDLDSPDGWADAINRLGSA